MCVCGCMLMLENILSPFLIMYICGFPSRTLEREDMGCKTGNCPPGSFWGALSVVFWVAFRTSKEMDRFSLNKTKVFRYYFYYLSGKTRLV